jgi:protein-S-isoprenylcysteine O-methyltransferase Ste14
MRQNEQHVTERDGPERQTTRIGAGRWIRGGIGMVSYPAILFGSAGTLRWPEGWVFIAGLYAFTVGLTVMLLRRDPELLKSRMGGMFRKGQPAWDKVFAALFISVFVLWLPLAGLDAVRFAWSTVPVWLEVLGGVAYAVSLGLLWIVFRSNAFLSPVVEIQTERGHTLVDTGPYAIVRHPMYAAMVPFLVGASVMLGSWAASGLSIVLIGTLAVRATLEERTLSRELPGYADYMTRVRYRLIPGFW